MTLKKRRKLKPYKISRGSFEERQLREDKHLQTMRALMIILPIVMVAVLAVGIFFAVKDYRKQAEQNPVRTIEHVTVPVTEPTEPDEALMTVVTPGYPLAQDYVPTLTDFGSIRVSPLMVDDLQAMLDAAQEAGFEIRATDGYVSYQEQGERYQKALKDYQEKAKVSLVKAEAVVSKTTPREGASEQQTGMLVYLTADTGDVKFENSPAYAWLMKNCTAYGFILRYPAKENAGGLNFSPHLYRYVGVENAYYITAYSMTFEEYVVYRSARE